MNALVLGLVLVKKAWKNLLSENFRFIWTHSLRLFLNLLEMKMFKKMVGNSSKQLGKANRKIIGFERFDYHSRGNV